MGTRAFSSADSGWPMAARIVHRDVGALTGKILKEDVYWDYRLLWINVAVGAVLTVCVAACALAFTRFVRKGWRFSLFDMIVLATAVGLTFVIERPLTWTVSENQAGIPWYSEITHADPDWPWFFYAAVYLGLFCVMWWPLSALCWLARVVAQRMKQRKPATAG